MGKLRLPSHTTVAAYLALFAALATGGAYAANELGKNDVKSKNIANGQVKNKDIADNAVTSPKVANGSLLGEDFAAGQLPQGPQGERGPQGEQGLRGPGGATNVVARTSGLVTALPDNRGEATANCGAGERATGGGFNDEEAASKADIRVLESDVVTTGGVPTGWKVSIRNDDVGDSNTGDIVFFARVICASP